MKAFFPLLLVICILLVIGNIAWSQAADKEKEFGRVLENIAIASHEGRENTGMFPASLSEFNSSDRLWETPYSKSPVAIKEIDGHFPRTAAPGSIYYKPLDAPDWMFSKTEAVVPGTVIGIQLMAYGSDGKQFLRLYTFPGSSLWGVVEKIRS